MTEFGVLVSVVSKEPIDGPLRPPGLSEVHRFKSDIANEIVVKC